MKLLFCHIPKTAGTTAHTYLSKFYQWSDTYDLGIKSFRYSDSDRNLDQNVLKEEIDKFSTYSFVYGHE